jgi:hypothetical protein
MTTAWERAVSNSRVEVEAVLVPETLVSTHQTTQCYDPQDHNLKFHCDRSLKSDMSLLFPDSTEYVFCDKQPYGC